MEDQNFNLDNSEEITPNSKISIPTKSSSERWRKAVEDQELIERNEEIFDSIANSANADVNQYKAMALQGVNYGTAAQGGVNLQRYYNRDQFKKLGFNPFMDNEAYYQANTTAWDDFRTARQQSWNLMKLGFFSYYSSENEFAKASRYAAYSNIGTSQREGFNRVVNNVVLNSGYTLGLLSSIMLEEFIIAAATGGSANLLKIGSTAARLGRKSRTAQSIERGASVINEVRNLTDVNKARQLWEGTKKFGKATLNLSANLIPGKNTFETLYNFNRLVKAGEAVPSLASLGARTTHLFGTFYRDSREILLAHDEAKLESGMIYNDTMDKYILQYQKDNNGRLPSSEDLEIFDEAAREFANRGYLKNMAIIYATNRISFGNMFNRLAPKLASTTVKGFQNAGGRIAKGFDGKSVRAIYKKGFMNIPGAISEGWKGVKNFRSVIKQTPGIALKGAYKYTRANIGEGIQEYFQEVVQHAEQQSSDDFYAKYKSGVRGAALSEALENVDFFENYGKAAEHFISLEGLEIFGTGAMMGFIAGPYSRIVGHTPTLISEIKAYSTSKNRAKRKAELKKQYKILDDKVKMFNGLPGKEQEQLYKFAQIIAKQSQYDEEMKESSEEGDYKNYYDIKDKAVSEYLVNAMQLGMLDNVKKTLTDMLDMSDQEFTEAFAQQLELKADESLGIKEKAVEVLKAIDNVEQLYENHNNIFPELIDMTEEDLELYGDVDLGQISQLRNHYIGFLIMNQRQLYRNMERYNSLQQALIGKKNPFANASKVSLSSISNLYSNSILKKELDLLSLEINTIKQSISSSREVAGNAKLVAEQNKELRSKERIFERLNDIYTALEKFEKQSLQYSQIKDVQNLHKANNPTLLVGTNINYRDGQRLALAEIKEARKKDENSSVLTIEYKDENGKTITKEIDFNEDNVAELSIQAEATNMKLATSVKNKLKTYLKSIATEGETQLDETKFDEFVVNFLDARLLTLENKSISEAIEVLVDPEVFTEYMAKQIRRRKDLNKYIQQVLKSDLSRFHEAALTNEFLAKLAKDHNVYLLADDIVALTAGILNPNLPIIDITSMEMLDVESERYQKALDDIKEHYELVEEVKAERAAEEAAEEAQTQEEEEVVTEEEEVEFELNLENVLKDLPNLESLPQEFKAILQSKIDSINQALQEKIDSVEGEDLKEVFKAQKKSIETLTSEDSQLINESIKAYEDSLKAKPAEEKKEKADTVKKDEPKTPVKRHPGMAPHLSQTTPVFSGQEEELVEKLSNTLDILVAGVTEEKTDGTVVSNFFNLDPLRFDNYTKFPYLFDNYLYDNLLGNARLLLTQEELIKVFTRIPTETSSIVFALNGYNLFGTVSTTPQVINSSDISAFESYGYPQEKVEGTYEVEMTFDGKTYYVESEEVKAFWEEGSALYKVELYAASDELLRALSVTETSEQDVVNEELLSYIDTNLTLDNVEEVKTYVETELAKNGMTADSVTYMEYVDAALENLKSDITIDNFTVGEGFYMRGASNPNIYRVAAINKNKKSVTFEPIDEGNKKGKKMTVQEKDLSEMRKVDPADIQAPEQEAMSEDAQEKLEGTKNTTNTLTAEQIIEAAESVTGEENLDDLIDDLNEKC
jgi:hypothetical protein